MRSLSRSKMIFELSWHHPSTCNQARMWSFAHRTTRPSSRPRMMPYAPRLCKIALRSLHRRPVRLRCVTLSHASFWAQPCPALVASVRNNYLPTNSTRWQEQLVRILIKPRPSHSLTTPIPTTIVLIATQSVWLRTSETLMTYSITGISTALRSINWLKNSIMRLPRRF